MAVRPLRDLVIYCDRASNTARELARRLTARRLIASPNRRLRNMAGVLCVNYGTGHSPSFRLGEKSILLNPPDKVQAAISKVTCYERFKQAGVPTVEFTCSRDEASGWLSGGNRVLARRDGLSGGNGISIVGPSDDTTAEMGNGTGEHGLPQTDFYTKYFKKTHEYRVHVFQGRVIDITQKKRTTGQELDDREGEASNRTVYQRVVRSLENGWIHAHEDLHLPGDFRTQLSEAAIKAVAALDLDFGAVDIIAQFGTKDTSKLYGYAVLEVNTAPGLANEVTLKAYVDAIRAVYSESSGIRAVSIARRPRRKRVRKQVLVWITTRKGARVRRMRDRWVYEEVSK